MPQILKAPGRIKRLTYSTSVYITYVMWKWLSENPTKSKRDWFDIEGSKHVTEELLASITEPDNCALCAYARGKNDAPCPLTNYAWPAAPKPGPYSAMGVGLSACGLSCLGTAESPYWRWSKLKADSNGVTVRSVLLDRQSIMRGLVNEASCIYQAAAWKLRDMELVTEDGRVKLDPRSIEDQPIVMSKEGPSMIQTDNDRADLKRCEYEIYISVKFEKTANLLQFISRVSGSELQTETRLFRSTSDILEIRLARIIVSHEFDQSALVEMRSRLASAAREDGLAVHHVDIRRVDFPSESKEAI